MWHPWAVVSVKWYVRLSVIVMRDGGGDFCDSSDWFKISGVLLSSPGPGDRILRPSRSVGNTPGPLAFRAAAPSAASALILDGIPGPLTG